MNHTAKQSKRMAGIDLLRMLSMYMVVILHILGAGGILSAAAPSTALYHSAWLLEAAAYCAVNCYALISGFVGIYASYRISRLASLWLQIICCTLPITLLCAVFQPGGVTPASWIGAIFPIMRNRYWYMTEYFGLFLCMPLLNHIVLHMSRATLNFSLACSFVGMTISRVLAHGIDVFGLKSGYSMIWLCFLYLVGGYIRKYDLAKKTKKRYMGLLYGGMILLSWSLILILDRQMLVSYLSPTICLAAVALLLLFANLDIHTAAVQKCIAVFSPAALGVYLIHNNPLIASLFFNNRFIPFLNLGPVGCAACVLLTAFGVYLICSLIDLVRIKLFQLLHIKQRLAFLDRFAEKIFPGFSTAVMPKEE